MAFEQAVHLELSAMQLKTLNARSAGLLVALTSASIRKSFRARQSPCALAGSGVRHYPSPCRVFVAALLVIAR